MLPVTAVRWCLVVQCTDAVLFFPTLLLSVNPCAQRSPGEIKNKKPQPKTYLWTINWYRFLPISQWALCGLLRPPLIAGNPGLHYSVECLCLLCSWINAIAWESLERWQTGASTLCITRCSRARLCPTLAVAAAFSSMCKGKRADERPAAKGQICCWLEEVGRVLCCGLWCFAGFWFQWAWEKSGCWM